MDKKANNHTNGTKTRPHDSNKTSPSDDDILADIRDEYREARKQLKSYNKFIDRYTHSISIIPILLSLVGIVASLIMLDGNNKGVGIFTACLSLGLCVASLILITICSARRSSVVKIENKMKDLRQEAVSYQRAIRLGIDKDNMSRNELGLFQESGPGSSHDQDDGTSQSAGITVFGTLAVVVWIVSAIAVSNGGSVIVPAIAGIITLIISIILMTSSKRADKHNGRALLILFLIIAGINFTVTLNNAQKAQQAQNTQACMTNVSNAYNPAVPNAAETEIAGLQACHSLSR